MKERSAEIVVLSHPEPYIKISAENGPSKSRDTSRPMTMSKLWLHRRSSHTQRAYRADIDRFRAGAGKPLASVTLAGCHVALYCETHAFRDDEMAHNQETRSENGI